MKICIPIREKNLKRAKKQVKKAQKYADYVEIWLDSFGKETSEANLKKLIKSSRKPVLAVCRTSFEKGVFKGNEQERITVLQKAVLCGAKFVDCGIQTDQKLIKVLRQTCRKNGAQLIISRHIWDKTPPLSQLLKILQKAEKLGANIIKIATHVSQWEDNAVLFELVSSQASKGKKVIIIGMGEKGKISRIGCALLGGFLTYVALDEKTKTAPGQLTVAECSKLLMN